MATIVTASATMAFDFRRASRNSSMNVTAISRMLSSTTAARPPRLFSQANSTSDSHSQAYQGSPALE